MFIESLLSKTRLLLEKNSDFLFLCSHDRSILLETSTGSITIFSALFIVQQSRLLDQSGFLQAMEEIFGLNTMNIIKHLIDQLDFDLTCIKLVLSILAFSTINYTIYTNTDADKLINMKTIIDVQDRYIELLWKYLLNKYDYHQTVICYSKLVRCLLTLNTILVELYEVKFFTGIMDSIVEQTKQSLACFD
jgi:hypothetical protein